MVIDEQFSEMVDCWVGLPKFLRSDERLIACTVLLQTSVYLMHQQGAFLVVYHDILCLLKSL